MSDSPELRDSEVPSRVDRMLNAFKTQWTSQPWRSSLRAIHFNYNGGPVSTMGRIQDMTASWFFGDDGGYGGHYPGVLEEALKSVPQEEKFRMRDLVNDSIFGFVSAEQAKYREIGRKEASS